MATDEDMMWLHTSAQVSIVELAQTSGLPESLLRELVDYGVLSPADPQAAQWEFSAEYVVTARTAARLRNDLELETPMLAMTLSFLERIKRLESEVRHLRAVRKE
ncbi:MAG: chaperone modulator CbpM [Usitatibacter sp.]